MEYFFLFLVLTSLIDFAVLKRIADGEYSVDCCIFLSVGYENAFMPIWGIGRYNNVKEMWDSSVVTCVCYVFCGGDLRLTIKEN